MTNAGILQEMAAKLCVKTTHTKKGLQKCLIQYNTLYRKMPGSSPSIYIINIYWENCTWHFYVLFYATTCLKALISYLVAAASSGFVQNNHTAALLYLSSVQSYTALHQYFQYLTLKKPYFQKKYCLYLH